MTLQTLLVRLKSAGVLALRRTLRGDRPERFMRFRTNGVVPSSSSTMTQNRLGTNRKRCDNLDNNNENHLLKIDAWHFLINFKKLPC